MDICSVFAFRVWNYYLCPA